MKHHFLIGRVNFLFCSAFLFPGLFLFFTGIFPVFDLFKWKNKSDYRERASACEYKAQRLVREGKLQKAVSWMKRAVEADPSNSGYIHELANLYLQAGEGNAAIQYLQRYIRSKPDMKPEQIVEFYNWLASFAISIGEANSAHTTLNEGFFLLKKHKITNDTLYACLYNTFGIVTIYNQGTLIKSKQLILGNNYKIHLRDIQKARDYFAEALKYNKNNLEVMCNFEMCKAILEKASEVVDRGANYPSIAKIRAAIDENEIRKTCISRLADRQRQTDSLVMAQRYADFFYKITEFDEILFVIDISGSMSAVVSDENNVSRLQFTKTVLAPQIKRIDSTKYAGMITVGGQCGIRPYIQMAVDTGQASKIGRNIQNLALSGETPLYEVLSTTPSLFTGKKNKKLILLFSDGIDSCNDSPSVCQLADDLCEKGIQINVFSLLLDNRSNFQQYGVYNCLANSCTGTLMGFNAKGEKEIKQKTLTKAYPWLMLKLDNLIEGRLTISKPEIQAPLPEKDSL